MDINAIRRSRLHKILQERFAGNKSALSRAIERPSPNIHRMLSETGDGRQSGIGDKLARDIEKKLGLPILWLDGEMSRGAVVEWDKAEDLPEGGQYILIDRYDLNLSAGGGHLQWVVHEKDPLAFRVNFFRAKGLRQQDCRALYVRGDSMEPVLWDGDTVLIDTSKRTVKDGDIYAVLYGDEYRIKRLFNLPGGGLQLVSDNRIYRALDIPAEAVEHLTILGRMVWRGGSA